MKNNDIVEKITPSSPNFQTELAEKIAEIVPEAVSDGKIDITKLRELVNGDTETATEKFGLFWPGKARAQAVSQIPTSATLIPAPKESVDWDNTKNIYIEGDNLEVLKTLQNSYRRKIKMIYIDPPYNTGKEFIYPDNFQEGLQTYLEYTGQKNESGESTESKKETGGRKHTNWLNMMYPRLQLAKSLLTDDGVIFISIDDNEQANLKKMCDEIFREDNIIAQVIWRKKYGGGKGATFFVDLHEYILCYAKDINNLSGFSLDRNENQKKIFTLEDEYLSERGKYYIRPLKSGLAERKTLIYPIELPNGKSIETQWICAKDTFKILQNEGRIVFKKLKDDNYNVYKKFYEKDNGGMTMPDSIFYDMAFNQNGKEDIKRIFNIKEGRNIPFENPKPVKLLNYILSFVTGINDIVLDFFSGSATTAHAVMQLNAEDGGNRTHIQVQLPEPTDEKSEAYKAGYKTISDIGKERIRRAGEKILTDYADKLKEREIPLDIGFRVYKLAPSNFIEWNEDKAKENIGQAVLDFADNKKTDTSPEALLTEVMLQSKITLDAKIEKKNLSSGGWVYVVDDGNLITYVDDKQITEDQAKEIADMGPAKLVVVDSAFNGNDALKINIANICKEKFIKEFKTI